ncbi:helix-turn-helix domain-containing protein [Ruminococcaceae bacterium OttesenSCG-928-D13]|nr:helix-turn-helix domain-containing protein [Ruminococcaceae bacterium OttesenSCG-928-D13]
MRNIAVARKAKEMSQKELAISLGVSKTTVSNWEAGRKRPAGKNLLALSHILGVTTDYILGAGYDTNANTATQLKDPRQVAVGKIVINVLGSIPAGVPVEAIEDVVDTEELSTAEFNPNYEYFGLKVRGDSMYPEYLEGDTVIIRKQNYCECGQDCAVYVNGYEATLKTVKLHEDGSLTLKPINTQYAPRTYTPKEVAELPVAVFGIVMEIRRKKYQG